MTMHPRKRGATVVVVAWLSLHAWSSLHVFLVCAGVCVCVHVCVRERLCRRPSRARALQLALCALFRGRPYLIPTCKGFHI